MNRSRVTTVVAALACAVLAACSAPADVPDTPAAGQSSVTVTPGAVASTTCSGDVPVTASFAPETGAPSSGVVGDVRKRGYLVVGVSSDSYLLGSVKPGTTDQFVGFDIGIAREVGRALLGEGDDKVRFKVITAADRIPAVRAGVENGGVDLVARNMTMTCDRWQQVNFSAAYFSAAQRVLVRAGTRETTMKQLGVARRTVCAPKGSTSLANVPTLAPGAVPYGADQHTACLALLQEGAVDAITGDDTVLAGLKAQDPTTKIIDKELTTEPYGLAVALTEPGFAAYINGVLTRIVKDGTWQRIYAGSLGPALGRKAPPAFNFTRTRARA